MTSRERVICTLNHQEPDKTPIDIGAGPTTGMHASTVYKLRRALGLPPQPVRVIDCYQMLGEIDDELSSVLDIDTVKVIDQTSSFGFNMDNWKEWTLFDGTPVLVPEKFNTKPNSDGSIFNYPLGDPTAAPSGLMPKGGYYFDGIIRQRIIDDDALDVEDNLEEFTLYTDEQLRYLEKHVEDAYTCTCKAILGTPAGCALGDIALVPGVFLKDPKGIRDIEEWYMSIITRQSYIQELFSRQTDIALENLRLYREAVGDKVVAVYLCGADFGTQNSQFCSKDLFREMYMPYYQKMTTWIHQNTSWKVFKHSCGAVEPLIGSFVEAGFDILNPVQCSAANMDPSLLKKNYGNDIVFWGGGVDTQRTLPFGTIEEVERQVQDLLKIFKPNGGFIFSAVHNIQAGVPAENVIAMIETFRQYRAYT